MFGNDGEEHMKEIHELREWLRSQKPNWTEIAQRAGVNAKTISRFVGSDDYSMNFKTFFALKAQMDAETEQEAA